MQAAEKCKRKMAAIADGPDKQGSLMDILVSLIMGLLECSEADAVGHAHKRMLQYHEKTSWAKDISQVDAAIDTFDWHDREQVQNEIDRSQRLAAESKQFQTDYVAKRAAVGPPAQHSRQKQKANQYPALPSHIQQKDAKVFLPPGCSIWKGHGLNLWAGHCPPYPRKSARWHLNGGEQGALLQCLRLIWTDYLEMNGMSRRQCPIAELFV